MFEAGHDVTSRGVLAYPSQPRHQWVLDWPGMVVLVVTGLFWTSDVERALQAGPEAVQKCEAQCTKDLMQVGVLCVSARTCTNCAQCAVCVCVSRTWCVDETGGWIRMERALLCAQGSGLACSMHTCGRARAHAHARATHVWYTNIQCNGNLMQVVCVCLRLCLSMCVCVHRLLIWSGESSHHYSVLHSVSLDTHTHTHTHNSPRMPNSIPTCIPHAGSLPVCVLSAYICVCVCLRCACCDGRTRT